MKEIKCSICKKEEPIKEKREITSTTYIRAVNRMTKNVNSWFGRGMGK